MNSKKIAATVRRAPDTTWRLHDDTPLGARLRTLFEGANNSEIARKLGVHNSSIHTIVVTGHISARMLAKVVAFTGCDPDWLLHGDEYLQTSEALN